MRLLQQLDKITRTPEHRAIAVIAAFAMLLAANKIGYAFGWLLRKMAE
jgi:hypothetical protein